MFILKKKTRSIITVHVLSTFVIQIKIMFTVEKIVEVVRGTLGRLPGGKFTVPASIGQGQVPVKDPRRCIS